MTDAISLLAKRMVRTPTIGFVGAGFSARSNYPTWGELLDDLYDRAKFYDEDVPEPGGDVDARWLAEVYEAVLSPHESFQQVLRDSFGKRRSCSGSVDDAAELDRMQLLVARLPFNHFITTNYDGLLEQASDVVFERRKGRPPAFSERCMSREPSR